MSNFLLEVDAFFTRRPLFFVGIYALLATLCVFQPSTELILFSLCLSSVLYKRLKILLPFFFVVYACISTCFFYPQIEEQAYKGIACCEVASIEQGSLHQKPFWRLQLFIYKMGPYKRLPAITYCDLKSRPKGGVLYEVEGSLVKKGSSFVFKADKNARWKEKSLSFSFVEWRYRSKRACKLFLHRYFRPTEALEFLEGLLVGEFDNQIFSEKFRSLGLSHILVISGFHFTLIVAFFGLLFRFLMPYKYSLFLLLALSSFYALFIGMTPSIGRAFLSSALFLSAKLLGRVADGLNSLGVALIILLIYNPFFALSIGFQMSFLATLSILLFYQSYDLFLSSFFKKRPYSYVKDMKGCDQFFYLLLLFLRKNVALMLAISTLCLPFTLTFFRTFSFFSLLYNLFFPPMVALCLWAFCFSLLLSPVVPFLFSFVDRLTEEILSFTTHLPYWIYQRNIYEGISFELYTVYLFSALMIGIYFFQKIERAGYLPVSI